MISSGRWFFPFEMTLPQAVWPSIPAPVYNGGYLDVLFGQTCRPPVSPGISEVLFQIFLFPANEGDMLSIRSMEAAPDTLSPNRL
jgi:hypothetical protein